jgi:hypothetical protein
MGNKNQTFVGQQHSTSVTAANQPFFLGKITIDQNFTVPTGQNAMTPGPVTVADGVTITVSDGSTWTVV